MGITYIDGAARGPSGEEAEVSFLVDSGATYSLLPESVWRPIGLEPTRETTFTWPMVPESRDKFPGATWSFPREKTIRR